MGNTSRRFFEKARDEGKRLFAIIVYLWVLMAYSHFSNLSC